MDLAQIHGTPPVETDRLPTTDLARLRAALAAAGLELSGDEAALKKMIELRRMYEPYVNALSDYLFMRLPHWIPPAEVIDNWQTSAWERNPNAFASSPTPARRMDEDGREATTYQPLPFDLFY